MSFVAVSKASWRSTLAARSPSDLLQQHEGSLRDVTHWGTDQAIVTRCILQKGTCSLPGDHPLWKKLNLEVKAGPDPNCFHGEGYEDCNRDSPEPPNKKGARCKIWHFHPYEREQELEEKYMEIAEGVPPKKGLQKTIADVKLEMQKLLGMRN